MNEITTAQEALQKALAEFRDLRAGHAGGGGTRYELIGNLLNEALALHANQPSYYDACDEIASWMNTQDDMSVHDFRSALNMKLLSMHPTANQPSDREARMEAALRKCREYFIAKRDNLAVFGPAVTQWSQQTVDLIDAALAPPKQPEASEDVEIARAAQRVQNDSLWLRHFVKDHVGITGYDWDKVHRAEQHQKDCLLLGHLYSNSPRANQPSDREARLEAALRSIAANTCCDKCQEAALVAQAALDGVCEDCPPVGYPTDKTRCAPCPRRAALAHAGDGE